MTAGLILAAGAGTRFGKQPKLLSLLNGVPLLSHAVDAQCAVDELEPIVVVLGARAQEIRATVQFGRAESIVCPDWSEGMAASLRCGATGLAGAQRILVTLGDAPTVTPALIRRFVHAPGGTRAAYFGQPGHPVVLGPDQLARLNNLSGDIGARELLAGGPLIECGDLASGQDVNVLEDLEQIRNEPR